MTILNYANYLSGESVDPPCDDHLHIRGPPRGGGNGAAGKVAAGFLVRKKYTFVVHVGMAVRTAAA